MIMCKELSAKDFFASIPKVETVSKFFRCCLEMGNTPLAIAATNDLLTRGYPDLIKKELKEASEEGCPLARHLIAERFPSPSMEKTVFENIILSAKEANRSGK